MYFESMICSAENRTKLSTAEGGLGTSREGGGGRVAGELL